MSSHTIPPVADHDGRSGADIRRTRVLRALRERRRRAAVGTIAARYSDRVVTRTWE